MKMPIMNFLSTAAEMKRKYRRQKIKLKNHLMSLSVICLALIGAELTVISYNYINFDTHVTSDEQLLHENEELKKIIEIALVAKNEHKEFIHIIDLLSVKPKNFKFTKIDINNANIIVEGYSIDSNTFNQYVENMQANHEFIKDMKIEKINAAEGSPYKVCTIKAAINE